MEGKLNHPIITFRDLDVYQNSYKASVTIATQILPKLPDNEKFDLRDQLSRCTKAVSRLVAEGFAKKHQKFGFQKYIDDAMAEYNEAGVCLEHVKDIYKIEIDLCVKSARQLFNLAEAWDKFKNRRRLTPPTNETGRAAN
jgi:four helix bundle protein